MRGASVVWFLLTCGLGVLIYFNAAQLHAPATPIPSSREPLNPRADFSERVEQVTAALDHLALPLPAPTALPQGAGALRWTHRRYDITVPQPEATANIAQIFEPLRQVAAGITLQTTEESNGVKVQVGIDGLLTHTLMLHWLGRPPRAAIIVDDLGNDLLIARALAGIDAPLTFAVRPSQPFSKEVADLAMMFRREVLVQLPHEGERPTPTPNADAKERAELLRRFDQYLAAVPHAAGIANELGAAGAGNADRTRWILNAMKEKNLFIIDSGGSHATACEAASALAVGCAAPSFALDDAGADEPALQTQLEHALQAARTQGDVIVVAHASPALAAALQTALPGFLSAGVELVPASTVVADRSLSAH